ncbi:hypothetical protein SNE40_011745 [Patella caerulea]|uniref:Uncharacterized protein n=1 Tax=Patella caerulea TaxID=87958 RepID=A0AAN8JNZ5_PATCE
MFERGVGIRARNGEIFMMIEMMRFTSQTPPDNIVSLFAVMRYVFIAVSVIDTMIEFIDLVDHEPDITINAIYLAEFDKTTNRLKEKLTIKKLQICMFILKEFYDMAKKSIHTRQCHGFIFYYYKNFKLNGSLM